MFLPLSSAFSSRTINPYQHLSQWLLAIPPIYLYIKSTPAGCYRCSTRDHRLCWSCCGSIQCHCWWHPDPANDTRVMWLVILDRSKWLPVPSVVHREKGTGAVLPKVWRLRKYPQHNPSYGSPTSTEPTVTITGAWATRAFQVSVRRQLLELTALYLWWPWLLFFLIREISLCFV